MNISEKAKNTADNCRFCWMCRHVCPIGNATGLERNTARARALGASLVERGAAELKEIADNIYECSLCGACTNNCVTGFDPKVFIQEFKTEIIMQNCAPEYIKKLLRVYSDCGNIYGKKPAEGLRKLNNNGKICLFVGADSYYNAPENVKNAVKLLDLAGVKVSVPYEEDSGFQLWFLTGKTFETQNAAKKCAGMLNGFEKVIVYDPLDLSIMRHEYKEWGTDLSADVVGFNEFLLGLLSDGKLKVKKGNNEYTLQDNYAYSRELGDSGSGRKIIDYIGKNREMLLIKKETNLAGHLIMAEYMPEVIKDIALNRWRDALNMGCKNIVTENTAEYMALNSCVPSGCRVLTAEEAILENM